MKKANVDHAWSAGQHYSRLRCRARLLGDGLGRLRPNRKRGQQDYSTHCGTEYVPMICFHEVLLFHHVGFALGLSSHFR
jgi:hypothetical protein